MLRLARQALTYSGGNSTPQARRLFLYLVVVALVGLFFIVPRFGAESSSLQQSIGYVGPPFKLAFTVQPSNTISFVRIRPEVEVQDALGNRVTTASNSVTIAIGTNPAAGTLAGTLTVAALNGVVTFDSILPGTSLRIDNPGVGYTLVASATNLASATSSPFSILPGTTFGPGRVNLATLGASATVRVQTGGGDPGADGVQLNIQHSADVTITSPACVDIFRGASVLGPTGVSGGTLIGCFLLSGNVSATTGGVMTFLVTRVGTGNPVLSFGLGGPSGSKFSDAGVTIPDPRITTTLTVTGAATISGTVTLQGRTFTSPPGIGHGIARVTSSSGGVTGSVTTAGGFTLPGVLSGTTLTASAPGYVSKERTIVVVVDDGSVVSVPAEREVKLRCGLVDNDNVVDISDITATVASFGRTVAARVDALGRFVDQNGDGAVNIDDITCVASNFGVSSPQLWP